MTPSLLWFRRDLRLTDHPALSAAAEAGPIIPVFILDDALLKGKWPSPNRVHFMLACLRVLASQLEEKGSRLIVRHGHPARVLRELVEETGATRVHWQRDYGPYARKRDAAVAEAVPHQEHAGQLICEPEDVLTGEGRPYSVFTPYRRRWETVPRRKVLRGPRALQAPDHWPRSDKLPEARAVSELPAAGEPEARKRLAAFVPKAKDYAEQRNFPGVNGTSHLSQDLRWGLLSPLEVAERCDASDTYVSELCWRDFYYHILWHHPRVVDHAFREDLDRVRWHSDGELLEAWKEGRTGFPIVDAAMRQLKATGWMHNRARMIVASFLTKDLLIDWRVGEKHFMDLLTDGDLASNNGGWQWAASTGTDPQPYFRIFNPTLQGKKFDPDGDYVRQWVPELKKVDKKHIHDPPLEVRKHLRYPEPVVDHAEMRGVALKAYEKALGK